MKVSELLLLEGLEEALSESLENMAFVEVGMGEKLEEIPGMRADDLRVTVEVSDPITGRLHLILPDGLVLELTETVAEDEASDALKKDVLAELANTIAGRFFANIFPKREFEMGIPECCESGSFELSGFENTIIVKFDAEGNELFGAFEYSE